MYKIIAEVAETNQFQIALRVVIGLHSYNTDRTIYIIIIIILLYTRVIVVVSATL